MSTRAQKFKREEQRRKYEKVYGPELGEVDRADKQRELYKLESTAQRLSDESEANPEDKDLEERAVAASDEANDFLLEHPYLKSIEESVPAALAEAKQLTGDEMLRRATHKGARTSAPEGNVDARSAYDQQRQLEAMTYSRNLALSGKARRTRRHHRRSRKNKRKTKHRGGFKVRRNPTRKV
jgi:hypothetical protein